jgi:hypothetical protein
MPVFHRKSPNLLIVQSNTDLEDQQLIYTSVSVVKSLLESYSRLGIGVDAHAISLWMDVLGPSVVPVGEALETTSLRIGAVAARRSYGG